MRLGKTRRMESILREFMRKGKKMRNKSYQERLAEFGLLSQERRVERYKILYLRMMILGKVPNIGLILRNDTRNGPVIGLARSNKGSKHVKNLIDRTLMVEGVKLYNAVPRKVCEYNGSFLGFKNCIDMWLVDIHEKPRDIGSESEARDRDGKPSNSLKDWMKLIEYDNSWVPLKKVGNKGKYSIDATDGSCFPT